MRHSFKFLTCLLILITLNSCIDSYSNGERVLGDMKMEQFKDIDFTDLQQRIDRRDDIKNGMDALNMYYPNDPHSKAATNFSTRTFKSTLGNNQLLFVHENLQDDSLDGIAFYLEYDKSHDGKFKIINFKQSTRCKEGRGHKEYSAESCE